MNFLTFKKAFDSYLIFSIKDIEKIVPGFNKMNLVRWQKKELLKKIRNKWYHFSELNFSEEVLFFIANKIYHPSYVSLESALDYYGVIPEAVFTITSMTSRKTERFQNKQSTYSYKSIKKELFFGYRLQKEKNFTFKIATLEKALLDKLYANTSIKNIEDIRALRFNKAIINEHIDRDKLMEYAMFFKSKTLLKKVKLLKQFLDA